MPATPSGLAATLVVPLVGGVRCPASVAGLLAVALVASVGGEGAAGLGDASGTATKAVPVSLLALGAHATMMPQALWMIAVLVAWGTLRSSRICQSTA